MPPYLRPMAPTAEAAILCGDPARALMIAQDVLVEPKMSNHNRGLWGYHGETAAGLELTVQATGIGGVAAAIVLGELARRGTRRAIRVGSARGSEAHPRAGACLAVTAVEARDGTSGSYGAGAGTMLGPDEGLTRALLSGCDGSTAVTSLPRPDPGPALLAAAGHRIHDLQSAALLAAAAEFGVRVAVGVVINRDAEGPLADEPHEAASLRLADAARRALEADVSTSG